MRRPSPSSLAAHEDAANPTKVAMAVSLDAVLTTQYKSDVEAAAVKECTSTKRGPTL